MTIEEGYALPSAAPGLGIAWDLEAIERLTVEGSLRRLGSEWLRGGRDATHGPVQPAAAGKGGGVQARCTRRRGRACWR